jgi:hypothetical protein
MELHIFAIKDSEQEKEIRERSGSVECFHLTTAKPDYDELLELIFQAESVSFWGSAAV